MLSIAYLPGSKVVNIIESVVIGVCTFIFKFVMVRDIAWLPYSLLGMKFDPLTVILFFERVQST
jgi:hypothetical protein